MSKREFATVESAFYGEEDHGILTCSLRMQGKGWSQGFGNLALGVKSGPAFVADICEFFGVKELKHTIGRGCHVLRSFDYLNDPIEGLEIDGQRFTLTAWRRKYNPLHEDRLVQEKRRIESEIGCAERTLREAHRRLLRLEADYTDWEKP